MFYTYILYSAKYDRFYTGHGEYVFVRVQRHNNKGVSLTKAYVPWQLVYFEEYSSRDDASNSELAIISKKAGSILNF